MRTVTNEELKEILEKHKKWLNGEEGGERANLYNADLSYANLSNADLSYADLSYTNLYNADLSYAYLSYADLSNAYLSNADLSNADLSYTNLRNADLSYAKNIPYVPLACPSEGDFIGWKKVQNKIIKLLIPADAKRSSATTNKCRCEFAKVLEIQERDGSNSGLNKILNTSYSPFIEYRVGEIVKPDSFDENRFNECSHGIHFFIDRQAAVDY